MSRHSLHTFAVIVALGCQDAPPPADSDSIPAAPPADEAPVFEIGLWPGEGIPVIEALRDSLPLRAEPRVRSPVVATFTTGATRRVEYDSTRSQTLAAAQATAVTATSLQGRDFGDVRSLPRVEYHSAYPRIGIDVAPGERVEYLQARAEGTCFVRARQRVIEADPCLVLDDTKFTLTGQPAVRWWVRVTNAPMPGWLIVSDSTAKVVHRTF